jgi:hypothetical protein
MGLFSKIRGGLYKTAKVLGDISAIKNGKILKRINPPRCQYWKSEKGNFRAHWKKNIDLWIDSSKFIDMIESEYDNRKEMMTINKNVEKEDKMLAEKKTEDIEIVKIVEIKKEVQPRVSKFSPSRFG